MVEALLWRQLRIPATQLLRQLEAVARSMEGVISNGDELAATRQSGRGREQRRCDVWHLAALGIRERRQ